MLLADLGANVLRIARPDAPELFPVRNAPQDRGRRELFLDLKKAEAIEQSLRIVEKTDVLIEGFRPGVMERLGLGPDVALARNPKLIYGRMTGWGQDGPLANAAGHDLTFLALTGVLEAIGPEEGPPVPPLNLIGDMGGGGTFLVIGILAALLERQKSGLGQVIDAAILDGTVSQLAIILGLRAGGLWGGPRGQNILDGGAPFYRTYRCLDGKYVAVAALEPKFFATLVQGLGLDAATLLPTQWDRTRWPALHREFEIDLRHQAARHLGLAFRKNRRLRCSGPELRRGSVPSAQRRPLHLCRGGRPFAAATRAAILPVVHFASAAFSSRRGRSQRMGR